MALQVQPQQISIWLPEAAQPVLSETMVPLPALRLGGGAKWDGLMSV